MSRYIDADSIRYTDLNSDMPTSNVRVWVTFKEWIDKMPTADVVEVVRCKDCEHFNGETHGCIRNPSVEPWWEEDYCSYGKRKEVKSC